MARPSLGLPLTAASRRLRPLYRQAQALFTDFNAAQRYLERLAQLIGQLPPPALVDEALVLLQPFTRALSELAPPLAFRLDDTFRIGYRLGARESLAVLGTKGTFRLTNRVVLNTIARHAAEAAVQVWDTVKQLVARGSVSALRQGVPPAAVPAQVWGQRILGVQLPLVAQTELSTAAQLGLSDHQVRSGVTDKTWRHAYLRGPAEPRDHHVALHGQTIPQAELFEVAAPIYSYRTPYPRHFTQTPIWDLINCTCAAIPAGEVTREPWLGD